MPPSRLTTHAQSTADPATDPLGLTTWGHVWRVAAMLAISAVGWIGAVGREQDIGRWFVVLDLALGATAVVAVFWRRRWPVAVAMTLGVISTVSISSSGPGLLAVASLATRRRVREIAPVVGVTTASWVLLELITGHPAPFWQVLALSAIVVVGAAGWGSYIGSRRERAARRGPSRR